MVLPATGWGAKGLEVNWPDYREPFRQVIRVRQDNRKPIEDATINVDLPNHFLESHKEIILVIEIESRVTTLKTNKVDFNTFTPYIKIDGTGAFSGKIACNSITLEDGGKLNGRVRPLNSTELLSRSDMALSADGVNPSSPHIEGE